MRNYNNTFEMKCGYDLPIVNTNKIVFLAATLMQDVHVLHQTALQISF